MCAMFYSGDALFFQIISKTAATAVNTMTKNVGRHMHNRQTRSHYHSMNHYTGALDKAGASAVKKILNNLRFLSDIEILSSCRGIPLAPPSIYLTVLVGNRYQCRLRALTHALLYAALHCGVVFPRNINLIGSYKSVKNLIIYRHNALSRYPVSDATIFSTICH